MLPSCSSDWYMSKISYLPRSKFYYLNTEVTLTQTSTLTLYGSIVLQYDESQLLMTAASIVIAIIEDSTTASSEDEGKA